MVCGVIVLHLCLTSLQVVRHPHSGLSYGLEDDMTCQCYGMKELLHQRGL
ncbi:hypothetical protein ACP70R_041705 [Stipagrostis hirtigluma subsp. patula]